MEDPWTPHMLAEGEDLGDDAGRAPYRLTGQSGSFNILFLHSDHLGSLRLVTDTGGQVVSNHKYLPFGEEVQPTRTLNPYQYAGYERDSESGMDYVKARYYGSGTGRRLTPDPLGDGYGYAANTPVNASDPSGLLWVVWPSEASGITWFLPGWIGGGGGIAFEDGGFGDLWDQWLDELERLKLLLADLQRIQMYYQDLAQKRSERTHGAPQNTETGMADEPESVKEQHRCSGFLGWLLKAPLSGSIVLPLKFGVGFAGGVDYIPATGQLIVNAGVGISPTRNLSAGPLVLGDLNKAPEILTGWSKSGGVQFSPLRGYQAVWSDAGSLGGPTGGSFGANLALTYGWAFDVGGVCQ